VSPRATSSLKVCNSRLKGIHLDKVFLIRKNVVDLKNRKYCSSRKACRCVHSCVRKDTRTRLTEHRRGFVACWATDEKDHRKNAKIVIASSERCLVRSLCGRPSLIECLRMFVLDYRPRSRWKDYQPQTGDLMGKLSKHSPQGCLEEELSRSSNVMREKPLAKKGGTVRLRKPQQRASVEVN